MSVRGGGGTDWAIGQANDEEQFEPRIRKFNWKSDEFVTEFTQVYQQA